MKTLISAVALSLGFAGFAVADEAMEATLFKDCKEAISSENLIAPAVPITNAVKISTSIIAILTPGQAHLGDDVHAVKADYAYELHASMRDNFAQYGAHAGVVEVPDGRGNPALWLRVWSQGPEACIASTIDNRVYDERANAPNVLWPEVKAWEREHPKDALVRVSSN